MSERWKLGWLESYNAYTGEPERFVYRPGDDEHTCISVRGENCDEDARRIVASVNAALGIPTETLEAGVVVVPMEDARLIGTALATCSYRDLVTYGGLSEQEYEQLQIIAARLQQNGGEGR